MSTLLKAVKNNDIEKVKQLIKMSGIIDLDIGFKDEQGDTALSFACMHGYTEIAKLLLNNSSKDMKNIDLMTALQWAYEDENKEIINLFTEEAVELYLSQRDKSRFKLAAINSKYNQNSTTQEQKND